jgi:release factor glutamine methyltransferase
MNIVELLASGRRRLDGVELGRLESEVLLAHLLGVTRAWLYANSEAAVDSAREQAFLSLIERRKTGEPVAYLTGDCEFWSLRFKVTPDVLIPRPETELLVEATLGLIPADADWRIADLGTGCGAIAIAIASERPRCDVHATEISRAAIEVAMENERNLAPGRVHFHLGSWLAPLQGKFNIIVSNPPYVARQDPHLKEGDCRFEPQAALTPGEDGLSAIRQVTGASMDYLDNGGTLILEHGYDQGHGVRQILKDGSYTDVNTVKDLNDLDRVTSGRVIH